MADISRTDLSTIIEEAYSHILLEASAASSTALQAFPTVNLGTKTTHLPVLATLPTAGWMTSEDPTNSGSLKPTTQVTWKDLTMVVEEIATIVPVHEDVLDDATVDVLTQVTTLAGQAIGKVLDEAIFFGTNKPSSWTSDDLVTAGTAAAHTTTIVAGDANVDDIVGAVNQSAKAVAASGFQPDVLVAPLTLRYDLANIRDGLGNPIFRDEQFSGFRTLFNRNAAWDADAASIVIADSSRVRIGVRQDIQVKYLDQATLTVGGDQINLAQRDMVALRFKARYAYVLGVSTTSLGVDQTPVAVVLPSGS